MADDKKQNGPAPVAPTKAPPRVYFMVEVASARNNSVIFPMNQALLRGRWDSKNFPRGTTTAEEFQKMPNPIPGIFIEVDSEGRKVRVFDLLDSDNPKLKEVLKRIEECMRASGISDRGTKLVGRPEESYQDLSDDDFKSWVYHVRRCVDNRTMEPVKNKGVVPSMKDIEAMPGLVRKGAFNSSQVNPDYVPLPKGYKAPPEEKPLDNVNIEDLREEELYAEAVD